MLTALMLCLAMQSPFDDVLPVPEPLPIPNVVVVRPRPVRVEAVRYMGDPLELRVFGARVYVEPYVGVAVLTAWGTARVEVGDWIVRSEGRGSSPRIVIEHYTAAAFADAFEVVPGS